MNAGPALRLEIQQEVPKQEPIDLLKIQEETGFYGFCFNCGAPIQPERLIRGADTCNPECQKSKRKYQRRFQKAIQVAKLERLPAVKRLLKQARRTAPNGF